MLEINQIHEGDCLELMKTLPDKYIDLVITDPPYVLPAKTSTSTKMSKKFVLKNIGDFSITENYFKNWFKEIKRILTKKGKVIIFCDEVLYVILFRSAYHLFNSSLLVWKKNKVGLGRNYRKTFELIFYAKNNDAENFTQFRRDILEFNTPSNKVHPTQKPVDLCKYLIEIEKPKVVLDCFCGSGSSLVACKELGIDFIGMELNEEYLKIAKKRLEQSRLITTLKTSQ